MSCKIVFTDYYYPNNDSERKILAALGDVEIVDCTKIIPGGAKSEEQLLPYVKDADALIVQFADINARVIGQMERCKVIARYAIGVDIIDIDAATQKGIWVANVPDYCINEVADTAMGHILNAMRRIGVSRDMVLNGTFSMDAIRPVARMEECTLGLLGFGNIARNLARKAGPFFKKIVAYDPYFTDKAAYPDVSFVSMEVLLAQSDVISIHVPLNASTRNMINGEAFARMKDGVVIVNTARGGLIDESALLVALDSGKVGYCGLDVISSEDFASSPLLHHPRVTLTPHIGWCSEEGAAELQAKTAQNVVAALTKGRPIYCVNKV